VVAWITKKMIYSDIAATVPARQRSWAAQPCQLMDGNPTMNGLKDLIRRKGAILPLATLLFPSVAFPFSRPFAFLLLLALLLVALAKHDRSGGVYFTLFLLVLIVIVVSALLIVGLAYIHRVISG